MAFVTKGGSVYFDGYDLKNHVSSATLNHDCEAQDCTAIGHSTKVNCSGLKVGKLDLEGYDDYAAGYVDAIFNAPKGDAAVVFTIAPQGVATLGNPTYTLDGNTYSYDKFKTIGEMAKFKIHAENKGTAVIPGVTLAGDTSVSGASGAGTGFAVGACPTTKSLYGVLHVTALGSGTSLQVRIQHCATVGGTYVTTGNYVNFTAATAVGGQVVVSAGTAVTDTYWKMDWTLTGGTTTATFTVALGIF